ncbi:hypothetical protein [Kitasatospora sp. LaBMicrA B282]|uniref:hypothetical protein n=1 Tax=Kitasatospora sp. LaBMicrA B282 TaxID=3420949 RepID=UPI003D0BCBBC
MVHGLSCTREICRRAQLEQWPLERTVDAIESCCGTGRLRAHRIARGWTLRDAVGELRALAHHDGAPAPAVNEEQLRAWETTARRPRTGTVDLLCRLYRTDAHGLGLIGDYRPDSRDRSTQVPLPAAPSAHLPAPTPALAPLGEALPGTAPLAEVSCASVLPIGEDPLDAAVDTARRSVERTLALTTVSSTQLEVLEERMLELRRSYVFTPPAPMLSQLLLELEELRVLSADRQPASVQVRLSEMTALVATLIADALMKLGRIHQAQRWYGTARSAADDSGNTDLRARVRAQAAMLPYYYGPLDTAVELARQARLLNRNRPTATGALAAAAEARALARRGSVEDARAAICQAQELFDRCHHGPPDDAWAFPERRLYLYLSGAYTYLGETSRARAVQQQALPLYPDGGGGIDPALLRLEEAICLVRERNLTDACQLAGQTYLQVPQAHRTSILESRAQDVIEILPASLRSARAVRELGDILALPAAQQGRSG